MSMYRDGLPQMQDRLFLTDGGLETSLIFHHGVELPHFASFHLMRDAEGRAKLTDYSRPFFATAQGGGYGFVLDTPTWRANADWGEKLGYSAQALAAVNCQAVALMDELRAEYVGGDFPIVLSGAIGPRGDGYVAGDVMSVSEAEAYHSAQIESFADTNADMVTAFTMNNVPEAAGITRAAQRANIPVAISFTVETDGRLPAGQSLREAIEAVDDQTGGGPAYYMINCAHPVHFMQALEAGATWMQRLRGIRANASQRSHEELDQSPDLDDGNPVELGQQYRTLRTRFPHITILGGCCGTDHRHVASIGHACKMAA
ncbi:MAG TPA: homocysteine S-methyltransferase family protein [Hyphomicrobium sp.]|nr:homocysteine S-methyltransferase family protein [Hyphomicrobium sp.]